MPAAFDAAVQFHHDLVVADFRDDEVAVLSRVGAKARDQRDDHRQRDHTEQAAQEMRNLEMQYNQP